MKRTIPFITVMLFAGSLMAGDAKDELNAAAAKLAQAANYSWKTTLDFGPNSQFRPGPTEGKLEKEGYTWMSLSMRDNTVDVVMKGGKGAIKSDDGWKSLAEAAEGDGQGGGRFLARRLQNFKVPAMEARDLAAKAQALKKDGVAYTGDLTEDGAKSFLTFGGRGGNSPEVSGAKGSVKFWVKDGVLAKYEFKVQGKISFNGNDRDIDRTTTVEIKDVGSTKVEVPDEAKRKLS